MSDFAKIYYTVYGQHICLSPSVIVYLTCHQQIKMPTHVKLVFSILPGRQWWTKNFIAAKGSLHIGQKECYRNDIWIEKHILQPRESIPCRWLEGGQATFLDRETGGLPLGCQGLLEEVKAWVFGPAHLVCQGHPVRPEAAFVSGVP